MLSVVSKPGTQEKLEILSRDGQYDLACACGTSDSDRRKRGDQGKWIYPVTLPNGGTSVLFKTLISNVCNNDCSYCPLREGRDIRRCSLDAQEIVRVFLDYVNKRKVMGMFLSSGLIGSADNTMEQLNRVARILRNRENYRGYIHLKVIPGASDAAIAEAVSLSSAVSLNIETPGADKQAKLSNKKDYLRDIIGPMKLISRLTAKGSKYHRVKQTTQFIVGAAGESDNEIVKYMGGLYDRLRLQRIYFSAYQNGVADELVESASGEEMFLREHRLYQVDFLMRRYGFKAGEIEFGEGGNLSLQSDPKQIWAASHPERFPVNANSAGYYELLRVPGLGPVTAKRILQRRKHARLTRIEDISKAGVRLEKARKYLRF